MKVSVCYVVTNYSIELKNFSEYYILEVELILSKVLQVSKTYLCTWPDHILTDNEFNGFITLLNSRIKGEPLAYLLGTQDFWTLNLKVNKSTLIPRPDTESLVELILKKSGNKKYLSVLDLGTGSGAIALSLATEQPTWNIIATDISKHTLCVAKQNALKYNIKSVRFLISDWFFALSNKKFDLIVSNPPYISKHDVNLHKIVSKYEPIKALISPKKGTADIEHIVKNATNFLKKEGYLIIEHGCFQFSSTVNSLVYYGYKKLRSVQSPNGDFIISLGEV